MEPHKFQGDRLRISSADMARDFEGEWFRGIARAERCDALARSVIFCRFVDIWTTSVRTRHRARRRWRRA